MAGVVEGEHQEEEVGSLFRTAVDTHPAVAIEAGIGRGAGDTRLTKHVKTFGISFNCMSASFGFSQQYVNGGQAAKDIFP